MAGSIFAVLVMSAVLNFCGRDLRTIDVANSALFSRLVGAVGIYVVVILICAFVWRVLLKAFGATPALWVAERQLLVSQIGKYAPGNVAQYLGRAAMTINSGVPVKTVGIAIVTETAATVMGGFLSVVVLTALSPKLTSSLREIIPNLPRVVWLGIAVTAFLVLLFGASLVWAPFKRPDGLPKMRFWSLLVAICLYAIAFLLLGVSLHLIVGGLSATPVPMSLSVAVFAVAWIAGFATPGAPGGLGVRESVIVLGLAPLLGGAAALSVALAHRGASVLGDVISFGLGWVLPKNGNASRTQRQTR
jgi:uncharacterized membrane protein YbhN (UPF0104 family)